MGTVDELRNVSLQLLTPTATWAMVQSPRSIRNRKKNIEAKCSLNINVNIRI